MEYLEIEGSGPLRGEVRIQGSKNAALPILAAAILYPGVTVLHNCPRISDVENMLEILRGLGCEAVWREGTLFIDAAAVRSGQVPEQYATRMRSSIMLLGSLLGRTGEAQVPYPGGCVIGKRPRVSGYRCGAMKRQTSRKTETRQLRSLMHGVRTILFSVWREADINVCSTPRLLKR